MRVLQGRLSSAQVAALTTQQVVALSTARLNALTTAQFTALTTVQIAGLRTAQVAALESADFAALRTTQIAAITPAGISALTTAQIAWLSTGQSSALTAGQIGALSTAQLGALGSTRWVALSSAQVSALTTQQVAALSTSRRNALTTAQFTALKTSQIAALGTRQVAALETADLAALSNTQLRAFITAQVRALTTAEVKALSTAQLAGLSTVQLSALSSAQRGALSTTQLAAIMSASNGAITPLMLDLDGHGVQTLALANGVRFDVGNTGTAVSTGWVAPGDGLLVLDRNHNGVIDNGGELFGSGTVLADGSHAADGFVALATLDANHDGSINALDPGFKTLQVWVDANSDGRTQAGELQGLGGLGITSLHLDAAATSAVDNGNLVGLTGRYDRADGSIQVLADVWLATAPLPVQPASGAAAAPPAALQTRVTDLVQSLGRFTERRGDAQGSAGRALKLPAVDDTASQAPLPSSQPARLAAPLSAYLEQSPAPQAVQAWRPAAAMPAAGVPSSGVSLSPRGETRRA